MRTGNNGGASTDEISDNYFKARKFIQEIRKNTTCT